MKQKDIAIILVIIFISGVGSFLLSNKLFTIPADQQVEVEVVEPITADFSEPDDRYFNNKSINPTQTIKIGDDQNKQPFSDNQD